MIIDPQCFECRRLLPVKGMKCEAFPDGIPDAILLNEHDHHAPFPGDHGLQFEPIAAEPPARSADHDPGFPFRGDS